MKLLTPTAADQADWDLWVSERPPVVRAVAERFDRWTLYRMKTTQQLVTLASIYEDGTVRVIVWWDGRRQFPHMPFGVFGVNPNDLEPAVDAEIPPLLRKEIDKVRSM